MKISGPIKNLEHLKLSDGDYIKIELFVFSCEALVYRFGMVGMYW